MTDFVYGEGKMIEIQKNYVITFTEDQARDLYNLLKLETTDRGLAGRELNVVYHELKELFDGGVR